MSAWIEPLEQGRCNKWKLCWSKGSGNNRKRRFSRFVGSKREANAALSRFEAECEAAPDISTTFNNFSTTWNDERLSAGTISQSTHEKYHWHIQAFTPLLPESLTDITPSSILRAYGTLKAPKVDNGKGWSNTTLLTAHNSLTRIFRAAVDNGLIQTSPMSGIDAPKNDTQPKKALSPKQASELIAKLDISDNRHFAVALMLRCGLRSGECCSLRWKDVDSHIRINRQQTKSQAGVRNIPLDSGTSEMIATRKSLVSDFLSQASSKIEPTDRLCCDLSGRPLSTNALKKWWQRNRESLGMGNWTLHELRHTYLTNLAQADVHPAIMQRLAGHASMNTTLKIYTHVHDEDMVNAVNSLSALRSL